MSRVIKMTPECMDECRADFEKALRLAKLADGKLSFTKTFSNSDRKAVVYFTTAAWAKMVILINEFEKEVAWHGVAHRAGEVDGEAAPSGTVNEYIITDILVYPQGVSPNAVDMNTEKYALWLMENDDDERFRHIRMQGHSHVRMSPTPSSVDLAHQEEILNMLDDDYFYIFMIWNKFFAKNIKIYDMKENTLFENGDVTVKIMDEVGSIDEFLNNAKAMVTDCASSYQGQRSAYNGAAAAQSQTAGPYNPLASASRHDDTHTVAPPVSVKEKIGEKPRTRIGAGWYGRNAAQSPYMFHDEEYGISYWNE